MYLIGYGTRPELIKLFPLINEFKKEGLKFKTLFTGQHFDLINDFKDLVDPPDYTLKNVFEKNQSINSMISKIFKHSEDFLSNKSLKVIIQGDTTTSLSLGLAAFYKECKIIHIEAGLRTHNKMSPFPEEINRKLISHLADIHFCPTEQAKKNLNTEGIEKNVYTVGNTIVDSFELISSKNLETNAIKELVKSSGNYLLCTLHRRENRNKINTLWDQLNTLSEKMNIIYIKHPSISNTEERLSPKIKVIEPVNYPDIIFLIKNSKGIISDSGGLQEEVISAKKRILVCRDVTERPETITSGYGKLVGSEILENIDFLNRKKINHINDVLWFKSTITI